MFTSWFVAACLLPMSLQQDALADNPVSKSDESAPARVYLGSALGEGPAAVSPGAKSQPPKKSEDRMESLDGPPAKKQKGERRKVGNRGGMSPPPSGNEFGGRKATLPAEHGGEDEPPMRPAGSSPREPDNDNRPGPKGAHSEDFPPPEEPGVDRPRLKRRPTEGKRGGPGGDLPPNADMFEGGSSGGPPKDGGPFGSGRGGGGGPASGGPGGAFVGRPGRGPGPMSRTPQDAELARLEQELEAKSRKIAMEYRRLNDDSEKSKLKEQLKELVTSHFTARQTHREKELKQLELEIIRLRESFQKRTKSQNEIIDRRISELLGEGDWGFE